MITYSNEFKFRKLLLRIVVLYLWIKLQYLQNFLYVTAICKLGDFSTMISKWKINEYCQHENIFEPFGEHFKHAQRYKAIQSTFEHSQSLTGNGPLCTDNKDKC